MDARLAKTWTVRFVRIAALAFAAALIHFAFQRDEDRQSKPAISLAEARLVFPAAHKLRRQSGQRNAFAVIAEDGTIVGSVLVTSPEADDLVGYSGPSNLIVGLAPDGNVHAVRLLSSRDTPAHVAEVERDSTFWSQFAGWSAEAKPADKVDAVSGSTLTSLAMAEAVQRRLVGKNLSLRFPDPLTLEEVCSFYPAATRLVADQPRAGWTRVENASGETLGYAVRTSPQADNVIGYSGPTDAWVAIEPDQKALRAVRLRKSYDSAEYVERVRDDEYYLDSLAGRSTDDWATIEFKAAGIEGVSGATQTSYAIAESMRRRFAADVTACEQAESRWFMQPRDIGLLLVLGGALLIGYTRLRGNRRLRVVWQAVLILGFGLWFGDLLSLALFAGWARGGVPWQTAPVLVMLAAIALIAPWSTRRQVYCHYLCPHGAAQEWLGRFKKLHRPMPESLNRFLGKMPFVLLAIALVLSITVARFDLSQLEPFDAWVLKHAAVVPAIIAVVGLIASVFVPMAYCRFGCPSGALFKLLQSRGTNDRFRLRDGLAIALLALGAAYVWLPSAVSAWSEPSKKSPKGPTGSMQIAGGAFGTTWNIKFRKPPPDADKLRHDVAAELERIESTLSHWRSTSHTSQFNASRTTVAMEFPPELIALVAQGQRLSEATDGAFDMTVAPLVNAWGYGPSGPRDTAPSDETIAEMLKRIGWQKLKVDEKANTLRKRHPELQLDLGALLQGYAADQVAKLLDAKGMNEYLIEVGGEMRARGEWKVAIENPQDPSRPLRTLMLTDEALATSGIYRKAAGTGAAHIIDPRTGRPVEARWQLCAVVAPTCLEADGWGTALLVSSDLALEIADREGVAALLADRELRISLSKVGQTPFSGQ